MTKNALPDESFNWKAVFTGTQVAATAPITIPPTIDTDLRIACP